MNELTKIIEELINSPIIALITIPMAIALVRTGYDTIINGTIREVKQEKQKHETKKKQAPTPCDIHKDCSECRFKGTGYCWKHMKEEENG